QPAIHGDSMDSSMLVRPEGAGTYQPRATPWVGDQPSIAALKGPNTRPALVVPLQGSRGAGVLLLFLSAALSAGAAPPEDPFADANKVEEKSAPAKQADDPFAAANQGAAKAEPAARKRQPTDDRISFELSVTPKQA